MKPPLSYGLACLLSFACLLSSACLNARAEDASFIDFEHRIQAFANQLGDLLEADEPVDDDRLAKQLSPRKTTHLKLPTPGRKILSGAELFRTRQPSVVLIGKIYKCDRCDRWHSNIATGFVIHEDGVIVTNYHVVEADDVGDAIGVQTHDGRMYRIEKVLASSRVDDLAVLKINATGLTPAPIAPGVDIGETIAVISHPVDHLYTYTQGTVSGKSVRHHHRVTHRQLTLTADFAKGSSGAPVFDQTGAVVGIVRATETVFYDEHRGRDTNPQMIWKFAVPSECLLELLSAEEEQAEGTGEQPKEKQESKKPAKKGTAL